jgi:phenylacetate-coenzyme A ligase PaaK-like adenylate-forming protein
MKALFVLLLIATNSLSVAAFAREGTIEKETITVGNGSNTAFTKIVDEEENRVCYTTTSGTTGGVALVCYDRKEKKSGKVSE